MRILERCNSAWPQQDMQKQINALREAFSADINRPFELKPGIGSPSPPTMQPSPPLESNYHVPMLTRHVSPPEVPQSVAFQTAPITPPMTASLEAPNQCSTGPMSNGILSDNQQHVTNNAQMGWNPTPIFEYVSSRSKCQ